MTRALLLLATAAIGCSGEGLPAAASDAHGAEVVSVDVSVEETAAEAAVDAAVDVHVEPKTKLGAEVEGKGVRFRVWAPKAKSAHVVGDFGDLAMDAVGDAVFDVFVDGAHAGSKYRFVLTTDAGSLTRVDPYCRRALDDGCEVVDPDAFAWKTSGFVAAPREQSIVYEMHVGSFGGTFAGARAKLASLADLGVNVVELMPVNHFGGDPNRWGYNPQLWHSPKQGLGTPDDLRAFVDEAHRLGIAVWLDIVVNHTDGWKDAPLRCFDGCSDASAGTYFFPPGAYEKTPWGPRPDYTKPRVAEMLLSAVEQWLVEYRGDGFRWDSVSNIRALDGMGNTPGGKDLLVKANALTHARGGISTAEDLKGYDALTRKDGFAFDAQWDGFGYSVQEVLVPSSDDGRDVGKIIGALTSTYAGDPFARLLFTENHDTVGNGGARFPSKIEPANPESFAARRRSLLGAVMLLTAPGVPMLFMGQEQLATVGFASLPTPLATATPAGIEVRALYRKLIELRKTLAGLRGAAVAITHRNDVGKAIAYTRGDVMVVVNMKNKAYVEYDVGVPDDKPWKIAFDLDGHTGALVPFEADKDGKPYSLPLPLGAYGALVLTR